MKKITFLSIMVLAALIMNAQVPTDSLKAFYPFNGNANDESGNGNNGTVNGANLSQDRFGNNSSSYYFDGIDDDIVIPNSTVYDSLSEITISAWVQFETFPDYQNSQGGHMIVEKMQHVASGADASFILYTPYDDDVLRFDLRIDNGSTIEYINLSLLQFSNYLTINEWHHITGVYDGDYAHIYFDGIPMISTSTPVNGKIKTTTYDLGISTSWGNYDYFQGNVDDIRIYSKALDSTEVSELYNEGLCYETITVTDTLIINANITGFSPVTYQNSIKIYPNPTNDQITIDFGSNYSTMNGYELKIMNSLSQVVYTTPINQNQTTVDLSTWTGYGIYFVHLINDTGHTIDIRKIVLQ
jgi:hypothetical protein